MALMYRNTARKHVVEVPEPADIIAAAEAEAERLFRKGTKEDRLKAELVMGRARTAAVHQRQTLNKMDQSRRWERYTPPPVVVAPAPPPEPVQPAEAAPAKAARPAAKVAKPEPEA